MLESNVQTNNNQDEVTYYRVIFKVDEDSGYCVFTDVIEQSAPAEDLQSVDWSKPIIRYEMAGHTHFIALDRSYLDAMLLGIGTYQYMSPKLQNVVQKEVTVLDEQQKA